MIETKEDKIIKALLKWNHKLKLSNAFNIAMRAGISISYTHYVLRKLFEMGWIVHKNKGKYSTYSINPKHRERIKKQMKV